MGGLQAQSAPVVNTGWVPDWRALEATNFVACRADPSGDGRVIVKPLVRFVALIVIIVGSNAGAHAQTAAPATAIPPGTTQGPWTSAKPGNSGSYCVRVSMPLVSRSRLHRLGQVPVLSAFPDFGSFAGVTGSDHPTDLCIASCSSGLRIVSQCGKALLEADLDLA